MSAYKCVVEFVSEEGEPYRQRVVVSPETVRGKNPTKTTEIASVIFTALKTQPEPDARLCRDIARSLPGSKFQIMLGDEAIDKEALAQGATPMADFFRGDFGDVRMVITEAGRAGPVSVRAVRPVSDVAVAPPALPGPRRAAGRRQPALRFDGPPASAAPAAGHAEPAEPRRVPVLTWSGAVVPGEYVDLEGLHGGTWEQLSALGGVFLLRADGTTLAARAFPLIAVLPLAEQAELATVKRIKEVLLGRLFPGLQGSYTVSFKTGVLGDSTGAPWRKEWDAYFRAHRITMREVVQFMWLTIHANDRDTEARWVAQASQGTYGYADNIDGGGAGVGAGAGAGASDLGGVRRGRRHVAARPYAYV